MIDVLRSPWTMGLVLVAVGVALRAWRRTAWERSASRRLPVGTDGIIRGAEPIQLGTGGPGVLLLHGFGDTPQSLRYLASRLNSRGFSVRVPLLPGHGRSLREFSRGRAEAWVDAARTALADLESECRPVSVVGQSMGGALALILGAESKGVRCLVLLAPYLHVTGVAAWLAMLHRLVTPVVPYLKSATNRSIKDADARRESLGFGVATPRLLHELSRVVHRASLVVPEVRIPTLVLHGMADPRITRAAAMAAWTRMRGRPRELRWLSESGHVIAADRERDRVGADVEAWLQQHGLSSVETGTAGRL